jgi:hypothetical protein
MIVTYFVEAIFGDKLASDARLGNSRDREKCRNPALRQHSHNLPRILRK